MSIYSIYKSIHNFIDYLSQDKGISSSFGSAVIQEFSPDYLNSSNLENLRTFLSTFLENIKIDIRSLDICKDSHAVKAAWHQL